MSIQRVYLIRHGETAWNATGRWQGILPVGLNDTGREQARKLAAYLADISIGGIHSSDLPRAVETAQILASSHEVVVHSDPGWRELNVGVFQGLTVPEIKQRYPQEYAEFMAKPMDYVIPEGESRHELQVRVLKTWQELVQSKNTPSLVAIVTHMGVLKVLLASLFSNQFDPSQAFPNTAFCILDREGKDWHITQSTQTFHLRGQNNVETESQVYF